MDSTSHSSKRKFVRNPVLYILFTYIIFFLALWITLSIADYFKRNAVAPYDFPGSVWESTDPFIHLEVSDPYTGEGINGFMRIGGEERQVTLQTTAGLDAELCDTFFLNEALRDGTHIDEVVLLEVMYKCSDREIVLKVDKDYVYGGQYSKITLIRIQ